MELNKPDWLVQMEGILETLNEGVLIVDDCNRIIFFNECMSQISGVPAKEVLGRGPDYFYQGDDLAYLQAQTARGEREGQHRYEFFVPRAGGSRVPAVVSSRMVEDLEGRQFTIITFTDITEQKRVERQLQEANAELTARHEEIERELALAARVQQSLAPQSLSWGPFVVEALYRPVSTIGGDFGLVSPLGNGQLNLLVCDVSGHGISAALIANRIYSETMSLLERRADLGEMLHGLNHFVLHRIQMSGFYFSMAAARLDGERRHMTFANAGHPPAICIPARGESHLLHSRSMVLGLLDNAVDADPVEHLDLNPGDRVLLYTDGLTEVFDEQDNLLGSDGLQRIVCEAARQPLPEMKQTILERVEAWRHGPVTDDMSLVLIEVV